MSLEARAVVVDVRDCDEDVDVFDLAEPVGDKDGEVVGLALLEVERTDEVERTVVVGDVEVGITWTLY